MKSGNTVLSPKGMESKVRVVAKAGNLMVEVGEIIVISGHSIIHGQVPVIPCEQHYHNGPDTDIVVTQIGQYTYGNREHITLLKAVVTEGAREDNNDRNTYYYQVDDTMIRTSIYTLYVDPLDDEFMGMTVGMTPHEFFDIVVETRRETNGRW